jgi:hypothetical protein
VHREGCRADLALVLEVQEQAIRYGAGRRSREGELGAGLGPAVAGLAVGVDVQVGEVTGTQGDQVAVGVQVWLEGSDGLAVPRHCQGRFTGPAGGQVAVELHLVVIDRGRGVARRQFSGLVP